MGSKANIFEMCKDQPDNIYSKSHQPPLAHSACTLPRVPVTEGSGLLFTWKILTLLIGFILIAMVLLSAVLLLRKSGSAVTLAYPEIIDTPINGDGMSMSRLRFVNREEWGAQPPVEPLDKMSLPVPYVIISHTRTDVCNTLTTCTFRVRFAQVFQIESRNWSDIAYNFLIGGDGYVYVGRGWGFVGAHSYGYNTKSIGISFIGTFNNVVPPKRQLLAAQQLIEFGVQGGKISPDYKLLGQRQISGTLSPGTALYSVLKTWPHWSPNP